MALCVTDLDPKTIERCLLTTPKAVQMRTKFLVEVEKIEYFQGKCKSRSNLHVTLFHETCMAQIIFIHQIPQSSDEYEITEELDDLTKRAIILFRKPMPHKVNSKILASKLDLDWSSKKCRFVFHGTVLEEPEVMKFSKKKNRKAEIDRIIDGTNMIGKNLVGKDGCIAFFVGHSVTLVDKITNQTVSEGVIESSFGSSGKFKVNFNKEIAYTRDIFKYSEYELVISYKKPVSFS